MWALQTWPSLPVLCSQVTFLNSPSLPFCHLAPNASWVFSHLSLARTVSVTSITSFFLGPGTQLWTSCSFLPHFGIYRGSFPSLASSLLCFSGSLGTGSIYCVWAERRPSFMCECAFPVFRSYHKQMVHFLNHSLRTSQQIIRPLTHQRQIHLQPKLFQHTLSSLPKFWELKEMKIQRYIPT